MGTYYFEKLENEHLRFEESQLSLGAQFLSYEPYGITYFHKNRKIFE